MEGNECANINSDTVNKNKNENIDFNAFVEEQSDNNSDSDELMQVKVPKTKKTKLAEAKKPDNIGINDKDTWEDIYGRKRDKEGNIIHNTSRYVPPAVRAITMHNMNLNDEKLLSLKKQLKGCLNRVTEQNMYSIANQVII